MYKHNYLIHHYIISPRFNEDLHCFLTNNLDDNNNEEIFSIIKEELFENVGENIYIIPNEDKKLYESWASVVISFSTIALEHGFQMKSLYPFFYSPQKSYWMHMTIFHFETVNKSIISRYLHTGSKKMSFLKQNLNIIRDSLTRIKIIE